MDISIIVPVFNVEKYLVRCLDSIFNQQFTGTFEVIAVEDGSTDCSLQLLYNYQLKEKRLKVIVHEKNKKLSVARATGIKSAIGDYVMHIDSDDWILPNTLASLFAKIREMKADVIVFNYLNEDSKGTRSYNQVIKKEFILRDKAKVHSLFFESVANKITKKAITENMITGEISVNNREDLLYSAEILLRAERICMIPECYYVYFTNTESLTHTTTPIQSTQNNIIILNQLQKIVVANNSNSKLNKKILNYFEKYIYLDLAKSHYWHKVSRHNFMLLAETYSTCSFVSHLRIKRLKLSIKSRFVCLLEIAYRFKFRQIRGILQGSFKKLNLARN